VSGHPRELLERYPDLLEPDERARVDAHLRDCPACRDLAAQLDALREAAGELGEEAFQVAPSAALDERTLARIRAEAGAVHSTTPPRRRWLAWGIAPVAAAALLLLLLHPASPLRGPDPGRDPIHDPSWHPKGDDDDGPRADLQLALLEGESTRPLAGGDRVPADAEILVGGVIPEGIVVALYRVEGEARERVWEGRGDPTTAAGGPLLSQGAPLIVRAPAEGGFALELVRATAEGEDGALLERIDLSVEEPP